jgi:ATP-dependent Lon protease
MTEPVEPGSERTAHPGKGDVMAVLPLRDIVVFPHMIVPLFVGREKSVRALEAVMQDDKQILLVAQRNATQDDPSVDDIYRLGTVSTILQLLKLPDGTVKVLVEGGRRAKITSFKRESVRLLSSGGRRKYRGSWQWYARILLKLPLVYLLFKVTKEVPEHSRVAT